MIKAIKIDPVAKTVEEVQIHKSDNGSVLKALYAAIGCDLVTVVHIDTKNDLWLDDEGLLKSERSFFTFMGQPFCGVGIVLGNLETEDGVDADHTNLTVGGVNAKVTFPTEADLMALSQRSAQ